MRCRCREISLCHGDLVLLEKSISELSAVEEGLRRQVADQTRGIASDSSSAFRPNNDVVLDTQIRECGNDIAPQARLARERCLQIQSDLKSKMSSLQTEDVIYHVLVERLVKAHRELATASAGLSKTTEDNAETSRREYDRARREVERLEAEIGREV